MSTFDSGHKSGLLWPGLLPCLLAAAATVGCVPDSTACVRFSDCASGLTCADGQCVWLPVPPADGATAPSSGDATSPTDSSIVDESSDDGTDSSDSVGDGGTDEPADDDAAGDEAANNDDAASDAAVAGDATLTDLAGDAAVTGGADGSPSTPSTN